MTITERFEQAYRYHKVIDALVRTVGGNYCDMIYARDRFIVKGIVSSKGAAEALERRNTAIALAGETGIGGLYGQFDAPQFNITWQEPFCTFCYVKPLAYEGAKFCGAACSQKHEAKETHP